MGLRRERHGKTVDYIEQIDKFEFIGMLKTEFTEEHQMTNEEQQAYFAQREQEQLDKCRIRSEKQFIRECKKADIHPIFNS